MLSRNDRFSERGKGMENSAPSGFLLNKFKIHRLPSNGRQGHPQHFFFLGFSLILLVDENVIDAICSESTKSTLLTVMSFSSGDTLIQLCQGRSTDTDFTSYSFFWLVNVCDGQIHS